MIDAGAGSMLQLGKPLIQLESTSSTMDEVDQRARLGAREGLAVTADYQSAGRGRAGREWRAQPESAILCSVLLKPPVQPSRLGPLPLVVGLGIAEAIEHETGLGLCLKWPNDLIGRHGKIGGVLLTSRLTGQSIDWVTIGFGINVNIEAENLPSGASSIQVECGGTVDRSRLLNQIFRTIERHYRQFVGAPDEWDRDGWLTRCCALGEHVCLEDEGRTREGELLGVDINGALQLRDEFGNVSTFVAGDLVRGPRSVHQPGS